MSGAPTDEEPGRTAAHVRDRLLHTLDARVWAREFTAAARQVASRRRRLDPHDPKFEVWVLGWFANAIATARRLTHRAPPPPPGS
jgi:hypothetical protein